MEIANDEKGTNVEVNKVGFVYPLRPSLQVLQDINVSIPSGKMIAFVGASGCGKSTMIALLQRFYDPITGEIVAAGGTATRIEVAGCRFDGARLTGLHLVRPRLRDCRFERCELSV